MSEKNRKVIYFAGISVFVILLLVDRFFWAQISQWREDQATNLWLGYTSDIRDMPVGLISSKGIPNPNGMLILGKILSILPNLLWVSFFLGVIQIVLLALVAWKAFAKDRLYLLLATLPGLTSVVLRSSSIEFWNQYIITLINIFFIYWAVKYLQDRSLWNLFAITILILLAPSLYLAGIVNAAAMTFITIGLVIFAGPRMDKFWFVLILTPAVIYLAAVLTWFPYFQNVPFEQLADYNKSNLGGMAMFRTVWESFFNLPSYVTFQWTERTTYTEAIKHVDSRIISFISQIQVRLIGRIYLLQSVFAFAAFICTIFTQLHNHSQNKTRKDGFNFPVARVILLSTMFIAVSYTISTWLGGPAWVDGERPDQNVQFFPIYLFIIFLLPFTIVSEGKFKTVITGISITLLTLFSLVNTTGGFSIIRDHLQYQGSALTEADIPLIDKMRAVEFIANDWKNETNDKIIPVDYNLGGDVWDWVPEFGNQLLPWYPAPMTQGRSFDFELLRRFGLKNMQEGIQIRTFGSGRYLITFSFEDAPHLDGKDIQHHIFGRLRVSIVE